MSKRGYFHCVKNKLDEFRHLACFQQENLNAAAYDCPDDAIILRQPKFKRSQSTHTFHNERKKVFKPMFVLESKRKDKNKSRRFRPLATLITSTLRHWFLTLLAVYMPMNRNNQFFCCQQILLNQLHKRQKYRDMRGRHPSVIDVWKFKTDVSKETLGVGVL